MISVRNTLVGARDFSNTTWIKGQDGKLCIDAPEIKIKWVLFREILSRKDVILPFSTKNKEIKKKY